MEKGQRRKRFATLPMYDAIRVEGFQTTNDLTCIEPGRVEIYVTFSARSL